MFYLLVAVCVVIVGGGAVMIERLTRQPEGVKRLLAAPLTALADVADATDVRVEGTVEALDGTQEAPVSGERCVYYEHLGQLEDVALGSRTMASGPVVHRAVVAMPFVLRDRTGYAIVDPDGATVLVPAHHPADGRARGTTAVLDRLDPTAARRADLHHTEHLIRPGDRLAVIGRAVREPDPDPRKTTASYRDGAATRLRFTHSPQFPLHLLDPERTF